uniref:Uncharacterized protein n=1 Tax=Oryza punctata TaxID=4537 RepID=A0A0E0JJ68_ORYPU
MPLPGSRGGHEGAAGESAAWRRFPVQHGVYDLPHHQEEHRLYRHGAPLAVMTFHYSMHAAMKFSINCNCKMKTYYVENPGDKRAATLLLNVSLAQFVWMGFYYPKAQCCVVMQYIHISHGFISSNMKIRKKIFHSDTV